jgi:PST family polysaccharide transporter
VALARPGDATSLALAVVLASVVVAQATDVVVYWFQSRSRFGPYVLARTGAFAVAAIARIAALAAGASLTTLGLTIALEAWLAAVAVLVAYAFHGGRLGQWRFDRAVARGLLADAWPLMINSVAILVTLRTDQVMLAMLRGDAENGIYTAAQRLSETLYVVPAAVVAASGPALFRLHREDRPAYTLRLARLFRGLAWFAIGCALLGSLVAGPLVRLLFGDAYAASGPVLAIHLWTAPALFLGVAQSNWFLAENKTGGLLLRSAVAAIVNVGLNLWLIPPLGARGAALATLFAHLAGQLLVNAIEPGARPLLRLQARAVLPGPLR